MSTRERKTIRLYAPCALLLSVLLPGAHADILETAATFAVLAGSTATNTGTSTITGNLVVSPGSVVTGFPPGIVVGTTYQAGAVAGTAQNDLTTAYNTLAGLSFNADLTGQDLGGLTLLPGVYFFSSSAQLTGTLTLNAQGSNNALWVFEVGNTLTTASSSVIQIINGGPGDGLFWRVGSSATLGTSTTFEGNILAAQSITLNTGAIIPCGRALAINGAVTMDTNVISTACTATAGWSASQALELSGINGNLGAGLSNPANNSAADYNNSAVPEPSTPLLQGIGIAGVAIRQKWARSKPQGHGA